MGIPALDALGKAVCEQLVSDIALTCAIGCEVERAGEVAAALATLRREGVQAVPGHAGLVFGGSLRSNK